MSNGLITADELTAEEIQKLTKVKWWALRECTLCKVPIGYRFWADQVEFDGNCECTIVESLPQKRVWQDIANLLNSVNEEVRLQMLMELQGEKSGRAL